MNDWMIIAVLFGLIIAAAGLGALCDRLDTRHGNRGRKP